MLNKDKQFKEWFLKIGEGISDDIYDETNSVISILKQYHQNICPKETWSNRNAVCVMVHVYK